MNGISPRETLRRKTAQIRDIPLSDVYVDLRFQRPVNPNQLNRIKDDYHPNGLGVAVIGHIEDQDDRPQRYAIIDGQTRFQAVSELHKEVAEGAREVHDLRDTLTAEVYEDLTIGEAALLFGLRNNQKPIPPYHRDRVLASEGDLVMSEVVSQCADAGYIVFDEDEARINMPHRTHARRILGYGKRASRPKLLEETLIIQSQAFGTAVGYLDKDVLQATAELLLKNPNVIEDEIVRVLTTLGLPGIRGQAEVAAVKYGQRMSKACRGVIVDAYNKGKRGADKIRV